MAIPRKTTFINHSGFGTPLSFATKCSELRVITEVAGYFVLRSQRFEQATSFEPREAFPDLFVLAIAYELSLKKFAAVFQ